MQAQLQAFREKDTSQFSLDERSDIANTLATPYTVFVKDQGLNENGAHVYSWIIYSLGRPQNIVWGRLTDDKKNYQVEYGCRYKSVKVINNMLEIKKRAGYYLVATLARDQVSTKIVGNLLLDSYLKQTGLILPASDMWPGVTISYRDIDLALLDICDEYGLNYAPEKCEITKAVEILAVRFLTDPNKRTKHASPIPQSVTAAILDFIAHTPKLNEPMKTSCYDIEECKRYNMHMLNVKECGLYHPLPEDQLM